MARKGSLTLADIDGEEVQFAHWGRSEDEARRYLSVETNPGTPDGELILLTTDQGAQLRDWLTDALDEAPAATPEGREDRGD